MTCASVNGKFDVGVISMCVVPTKISHKNYKKTVRSYAILDNCSQKSFIEQYLLRRLGVDGQKLNLKTLTGEKSNETLIVDNLKVAGVNRMINDWISLPKVHSKKTLLVEKEEVATPEKVSKWNYLDSVKAEITQIDDIEIGMLIRANCMKALEPLKIISNKDGGAYAYQTKLGLCIVGPIQNIGHHNSIKCYRVAVTGASTGKLSMHHFHIENASKDMSIEQMFEQMHYNDVNEKGAQIGEIDGNLEQLSKNYKRFPEILDTGTRKNGNHYEVPKGIKIPSNGSQALKTMHQLKRRLKKDSSFFQDYQCVMDDLVANEFSRKATSPSTDDSTWYLPHHGVYQPFKPGKIRVVFDCSAEIYGTSLNKKLLPGPDLTSQLVGVLTRFRTEEVAFMFWY